MHLSPEILEAAYELLRTTSPFKSWRLPTGEEVEFHVFKDGRAHAAHAADYDRKPDGTHVIRINQGWCGNLESLLKYIAHEMAHLKHAEACPKDKAHHGQEFRRLAKSVCRYHHWDPKTF